jgi:hypothetical protein
MRDSTFEASVAAYEQDPGDFFRYIAAYRSSEWLAENALWLAVLEDAYHCLRPRRILGRAPRRGSRRAREGANERYEAEAWIRSDADHVGSFCFVCDVLGLESEWIRQLMIGPRGTRNSA